MKFSITQGKDIATAVIELATERVLGQVRAVPKGDSLRRIWKRHMLQQGKILVTNIDASEIAVCICTFNRPDILKTALESVARSSLTPGFVLVSDDSPDDLAQKNIEVCSGFSFCTYTTGPRRGLGANRNHCLDSLPPAVKWILFIDDDVKLDGGYIEAAVNLLKNYSTPTVITGYELNLNLKVLPRSQNFWGHQNVVPSNPKCPETIVINSTLFPRVMFDQVRFDGRLKYGYEEVDIATKARTIGISIHFTEQLFNHHFPSPVNRSLYDKHLEYSRIRSVWRKYALYQKRPLYAFTFLVFEPIKRIVAIVVRRKWSKLVPYVGAYFKAVRERKLD